MDASLGDDPPLRILHVLRAPLGGLWRHVVDLTRAQVARGHAVGLITDASTGGARADATLNELAPLLALGVSRTPMRRNPHPSDLRALWHVTRRIADIRPDVVHGHGSKGGMLARVALSFPSRPTPIRAYTPHGGSLNYRPGTRLHELYMQVEAALQRRTDLVLFESGFIASRYATYVRTMPRNFRVIPNGITPDEYEPIEPAADATDFVYVGELRAAKGVDTLMAALARAGQFFGAAPSLTLVGSGPDRQQLEIQAIGLGLKGRVVFRDPMQARAAFRLGRTLVVPSRAESMPYIVLEAAGACLPMIATDVGGIPEIFGPLRRRLIAADNVGALSDRLIDMLCMSPEERAIEARNLRDHVRGQFSVSRMVDGVLAAYRDARVTRGSAKPMPSPVPAALAH